MILIYLDESGTNYQIKDGLYVDGPFLIMGAMCVYEDVYWSMERLFVELIDKYFGIENWLNHEIHATDIWAGNDLSSSLDVDKRRAFFDEFLQLCGKFGLPFIFSFNPKCKDQDVENKNLDIMIAAQCLLTGIEHNLAEIHQTGVLVCDSSSNFENLRISDILEVDIKTKCLSPGQALLRQFYEMTSWRSTTTRPINFTIKPRYPMEAMSVYLIDRVHFLHSDDSLFLQMCDIMTFIVQRTLVHDYLLAVHRDRIKPEKVPVTKSGWDMMRDKLSPSFYEKEQQDVMFVKVLDYATECLLFDFRRITPLNIEIQSQYKAIQQTSE